MIQIQRFVCNYYEENCYVLFDETKEAVIIDCGCLHRQEEERLAAFIKAKELTPKHLLCTHLHLDHIFGNAFVHKTYGLVPQAHHADLANLPSLQKQAEGMGIQLNMNEVPVDTNYLKEGDVIRFGNTTLAIYEVPGHSPGSIAFYSEQGNFVVSGDALFRESIGRTDLWGGNHQQLLRAIREKLFTLPDNTAVYSGHGPQSSIGHEKKYNPFF